jgi:NADP-dependent 3-hydroxy acid dehydrogenase YdfG
VTKEEEWAQLWSETVSQLGYVSVLINNAGLAPKPGGATWKTCVDVMVYGVGMGTNLAVEKMSKKNVRTVIDFLYHTTYFYH